MLKISDNRRFIVRDDGTPFFFLGDTAWRLFNRTTREEADVYLEDRAEKRFTVIQAIVLGFSQEPNVYGDAPLKNGDPTKPNEAFLSHVDYVVNKAESLGLAIGMLPTWGSLVSSAGADPSTYKPLFNVQNARLYGRIIGRRYANKPIIWILGGDQPAGGVEDVWRAMAEGVKDGDGGANLMTYHPRGQQTSSTWLHDEKWLDFNMIQSGHRRERPNHGMIAEDYARRPPKPVVDGEPCYEGIPNGLRKGDPNDRFGDRDVRRRAYWGLFAGACGHTYGANEVFQFWTPDAAPGHGARIPWREALQYPGAGQMQHARRLIESRPVLSRIPDQTLVVSDAGEKTDRVLGTRDEDGSYAFVYVPSGQPLTVDLEKLSGEKVAAYWYDPRVGCFDPIGTFPKAGEKRFTPPSGGEGNDWILVLDDAGKGYGAV